jgi:aspartate kinase
MQNSAISFSICADYNDQKILELKKQLQNRFNIAENSPVELLTISNCNDETFKKLVHNKTILLEQRTRKNIQLVIS